MILKEFNTEIEDLHFLIKNFLEFEKSEDVYFINNYYKKIKELSFYQFLYFINKVLSVFELQDCKNLICCFESILVLKDNINDDIGNCEDDPLIDVLGYYQFNSEVNYFELYEELTGQNNNSDEILVELTKLLIEYESEYGELQYSIRDYLKLNENRLSESLNGLFIFNYHLKFGIYINDAITKAKRESLFRYNSDFIKKRILRENILIGNNNLCKIIFQLYNIDTIKDIIVSDLSLNEYSFLEFKNILKEKLFEIEIYNVENKYVNYSLNNEVKEWLDLLSIEKVNTLKKKINVFNNKSESKIDKPISIKNFKLRLRKEQLDYLYDKLEDELIFFGDTTTKEDWVKVLTEDINKNQNIDFEANNIKQIYYLFLEFFEKYTHLNAKDFYQLKKFTRRGKLLSYDSAKSAYSKTNKENGGFHGKAKMDEIIISFKKKFT